LSDSTAIVQWLEECFPSGPKLFPEDLWLRARVRSLAAIISSDTQPLQNLTVLHRHSSDLEQQKKWAQEVIFEGLQAFERAAAPFAGDFSVGHQLSWADLCLLPQLYNAERFGVSLDSLPVIRRVRDHAVLLESYRSSHPSRYEPQSP
jgi:maleylacetoacetate isomerase